MKFSLITRMHTHACAHTRAHARVTERIDAVINCTPIRVKTKSKLTNFMKLIRIEGYNSKYRSNPQGNKGFSRDLLEFDQIRQ